MKDVTSGDLDFFSLTDDLIFGGELRATILKKLVDFEQHRENTGVYEDWKLSAELEALFATQMDKIKSELLAQKQKLLSAAWTTANGHVEVDDTAGHPVEVEAVPTTTIETTFAKFKGGLQ